MITVKRLLSLVLVSSAITLNAMDADRAARKQEILARQKAAIELSKAVVSRMAGNQQRLQDAAAKLPSSVPPTVALATTETQTDKMKPSSSVQAIVATGGMIAYILWRIYLKEPIQNEIIIKEVPIGLYKLGINTGTAFVNFLKNIDITPENAMHLLLHS